MPNMNSIQLNTKQLLKFHFGCHGNEVTIATRNIKYPFHTVLGYVIYNLLDISVSYFIKISSYRERLNLNSQRTQKCTFHLDFRGERVEK